MSNESQSKLFGFFDDLMKGTPMGKKEQEPTEMPVPSQSNLREIDGDDDGDGDEEWNESDFRNELQKRDVRDQAMDASENESSSGMDRGNVIAATDEEEIEEETEFDGYMLRDAIYNKWGQCFDINFQPVTTFGFRELYLNVMPVCLGSRRFRHETELDYLCHLQAVVEILDKYDQLDYVLLQLEETKKKPRANTSPLVAVPFRLDLTEDELNKIMSNM